MGIGRAALRNCNEPMEAWDPDTETWVADAFNARIDLMDRFLSNFNKPTRRRMMFAAHDTVFPDSLIVRHPGTLDVYLVGGTRIDARRGRPYIGMSILQLATDTPGTSSGYATITRKVAQGPTDDPGWLVDTTLFKTFVDTEFRTSSDEENTHELKIENFLFYMSRAYEVEPWDYIHLHGKDYRVIDFFPDSGLSSGRVDEIEDTRIDFILHDRGTGRVYDKTAQKFTGGDREYHVTGVILQDEAFALWTSAEDYVTVYIERGHIGIVPKAETMSLVWQGRERVVRQVNTQGGTQQWELRCN